jgi:C_GCAxxG_C_C family probable redox protein
MTKSEEALLLFSEGFNCSQSVFTVFGKEFGLKEENCLKIACPFGGGMGRRQLTCGAVTGALLVLGLKFGMTKSEDTASKIVTYGKTNDFFAEFKKRNSSICCRELLQGLDMNDPEDLKTIKERNLFRLNCDKYVEDAVEIVGHLISTE